MKTNHTSPLKQYARVARVFPKAIISATNARIRALTAPKPQN